MDVLTSVSPSKTSETELLTFLTQYANANEFPFALWRLPNSSIKYFLISDQHQKLSKDGLIIEDLPPGFIFAPFDRKKESIFLAANFLFGFENGKLKEAVSDIEKLSTEWLEKEFRPTDKLQPITFNPAKGSSLDCDDKDFISLIHRCMHEVEKRTFEKIVPSRTKHIKLPADFDILNAFQKLCSRYSQALISFVNMPGLATWLSATPEVLVTVEDKRIFKTVALAGTQPYYEGLNLKTVAWTQKEIEEQALVERYIISCFKKIRLREYDEHGPKTVVAGNLIHLKSDFTVVIDDENFSHLGSTMLNLLHPTSAVCGMPLEPAQNFLSLHEGYDRSYYSGYLGPVNVNNNINIFVNLRCMQLFDREAILYAGAGITSDSIPEKEFEETEMKFNTLLNVIF